MIGIKTRKWSGEVRFMLFDYEFGDFPIAGAAMSQYQIAMIFGVGTYKEYRNRGYCSALMKAVVEYARGIGKEGLELLVFKDNTPAIKAYEGAGFRIYHDGGDYYRMRVSLKEQK